MTHLGGANRWVFRFGPRLLNPGCGKAWREGGALLGAS
jgi:hypothetical protein